MAPASADWIHLHNTGAVGEGCVSTPSLYLSLSPFHLLSRVVPLVIFMFTITFTVVVIAITAE